PNMRTLATQVKLRRLIRAFGEARFRLMSEPTDRRIVGSIVDRLLELAGDLRESWRRENALRPLEAPLERYVTESLRTVEVAVAVVNRDPAVLDWMRDLWNGWVVAGSNAGGFSRPSWAWRSPAGTSAAIFLTGVRPWLRIKGPQCDNALSMIEVLQRSRYTLGRKFLPPEWQQSQEDH